MTVHTEVRAERRDRRCGKYPEARGVGKRRRLWKKRSRLRSGIEPDTRQPRASGRFVCFLEE